ncbi:MAG: hypothetical protein Kow00117_13160 [Phototrophicales bacterium]|nr:MAG: hypothetical protein CUN56_01090 [Phototrophicales bacterium]RMG77583.1 MAG: FHA domain-containing protein [Chloroflexota bacterium]
MMSDQDPKENTTHDVRHEAEEAMRRYQEQVNNAELERGSVPLIQGDVTLRLEVQGATTPMLVTIGDDVVIGRRDPTMTMIPDLDLTPYGAYQMGISRRHAILRVHNQRLELIDLGSRNGSYLNGRRLVAHQPVQLANGDEVRLGKIIMRLFIQD